jgi:hypothetical protein
MTSAAQQLRRSRLYVTWHQCMDDDQRHAITDEDFADRRARRSGCYRAVCGAQVIFSSSFASPGPKCGGCAARLSLSAGAPPAERHSRTESPPWWHIVSRLRGSAADSQVPRQRQGESPEQPVANEKAPVETDVTRLSSVSAGHLGRRNEG